MFERFDEASKRAVFFARWQAGLEGSPSINTFHLVRGALKADPALASDLVSVSDGRPASAAFDEMDLLRRSDTALPGSEELPLSANATKALIAAGELAERAGRRTVTCGDLVRAAFQVPDSSAAKALEPYADSVAGLSRGRSHREVPILLLGVGGVGRALIRQIIDLRDVHFQASKLVLQVRLVADSEAVLTSDGPTFRDERLQEIVQLKANGWSLSREAGARPWPEGRQVVVELAKPGSIVVDCSATDDMARLFADLVRNGAGLVLANKKPLTAEQPFFDAIAGKQRPPLRSRWESTVGAGLPVIATLNRLSACGDPVESISGSLSSTLGYLMTGLQDGCRFSELVHEVMRAGYTEPDPREDLRGADVARKAVIMARTLGQRVDLWDVSVESLYPPEMDILSVTDFMRQLSRLDAGYQARRQAAAERGNVLRYLASLSAERIRVGVGEVPVDSPLGRLTGTNQLVEIHSRWYTPDPLVIQGRGAGVNATAAGVLADIVELALQLSR